jgi:fucose 4-O-acetylase-like acetyltransferase
MKAWDQALDLARRTPADRNRYVDFLRAFSILVVVCGHWLGAAVQMDPNGELSVVNPLELHPWLTWLTWLFQVMPIFFLVGGYSNLVGWRSAIRDATPYGAWLRTRLRRLLLPVVPLILFWGVVGGGLALWGADPDVLDTASRAALMPVWFLATYVLVVALTPPLIRAWDRWGWWSLAALAAAATLIDLLFLGDLVPGFLNYVFVWGGVHQLGIAWGAGAIDRTGTRRWLALGGLAAALLLVVPGPYPVSMVGLDSNEINNTLPPTIALLAVGVMQAGLALLVEKPVRRWLDRPRAWAGVVLVNGMIMTIYLWHLTALMAFGVLLVLSGGFGLGLEVDTPLWWATRPLWLLLLALALVPFIIAFGRFERPHPDHRPPPPSWRPILGVVLACIGMAFLAAEGLLVGTALNVLGLGLPLLAAAVGGVGGARWFERNGPVLVEV